MTGIRNFIFLYAMRKLILWLLFVVWLFTWVLIKIPSVWAEYQPKESYWSDSYEAKINELWLRPIWADAHLAVSSRVKREYWVNIPPEAFLAIWLSEDIYTPRLAWDRWCSLWAYQMNICAWRGRYSETWFGMSFRDCANDVYCSTKRVADKIINVYGCSFDEFSITNRAYCLPKHQWYRPALRYKQRLYRNAIIAWF